MSIETGRWIVTTENGRQYDIDLDTGFWARSPHWAPHRTWMLQAGDQKVEPWNGGTWEERMPEVGEHLYIGDRDQWFVSNKVISIEEKTD